MENYLKQVYRWSWARIEDVYVEGDRIVANLDSKIEEYSPLDYLNYDYANSAAKENNLLGEFAAINTEDPDSIVKFIKKYGLLSRDVRLESVEDIGNLHFEPIADFIQEVMTCRSVVGFYLLTKQNPSVSEVKDYILGMPFERFNIMPAIYRDMIFDDSIIVDGIPPERRTEFLCKCIIVSIINQYTKEIKMRLIIDKDTLEFRENWGGPDLLSIIYFIFYLVISSKKVLKKCANNTCNKYFVVLGNYRKKKYCCADCAKLQTVRNWREKKRNQASQC